MLNLERPMRVLVSEKFTQARASQALIFSETKLAILQASLNSRDREESLVEPVRIQLRYCPALSKKPQKHEGQPTTTKPFDPFEDPSQDLLIESIPGAAPSHNLVLNKYPVIKNHFILATKENKPQTGLLEENDIYLSLKCLQAWRDDSTTASEQTLFAFFNSGEHSGASQPHRHLQFLPFSDMAGPNSDGWHLLCDSMLSAAYPVSPLRHNPDLPFIHFAVPLHDSLNATEIHENYILLLRAALAQLRYGTLENLNTIEIKQDEGPALSYNLAMTSKLMAILPRQNGASAIPGISNGVIEINGTILAGTMMVKAQQDYDHLQNRPQLIGDIFQNIAFSRAISEIVGKQSL